LFQIAGDVEPGKAARAVQLSIDKYCSVAETLRRAGAVITYEVMVNETVVS
jgi:putative redox protein